MQRKGGDRENRIDRKKKRQTEKRGKTEKLERDKGTSRSKGDREKPRRKTEALPSLLPLIRNE